MRRRGENPKSGQGNQHEAVETERLPSVDEVFSEGTLERGQHDTQGSFELNRSNDADDPDAVIHLRAAEADLWHRILMEGDSLFPATERARAAERLDSIVQGNQNAASMASEFNFPGSNLHSLHYALENERAAAVYRVLTGKPLRRRQLGKLRKSMDYEQELFHRPQIDKIKTGEDRPSYLLDGLHEWGSYGIFAAQYRLAFGELPVGGSELERLREGYTDYAKHHLEHGRGEQDAWLAHRSKQRDAGREPREGAPMPVDGAGALAYWRVLQAKEVRIPAGGGIELR